MVKNKLLALDSRVQKNVSTLFVENDDYLVLLLYPFDFVKFYRCKLEKQSTIKKQFVRVNFFMLTPTKAAFSVCFFRTSIFSLIKSI